ncbi:phage tail tape measure protein [Paenibacillus kribbensis]|uniref:phage tail tape measure protein n=1 Tax=Paenibacillus kribbensis TaxID=172713 RepID=UPI002DBE7D49|nr:phage tail tape measure protein [Paenibacillus kribbensis]MEC0234464.1 phage tail tape measure protein [Paenibacillus kribbensis]
MMDRFSAPLRRVNNQVQTAINSLERMRRLVERPVRNLNIKVHVDDSDALRTASRIRGQIESHLRGITARVELQVNAQLTGAMGSLDSTMERLRLEVQTLIATLQSGGGPGPGPGGGGDGGLIFGGFGKLMGLAAGLFGGAALVNGTVGGAARQQQMQGGLQAQTGVDQGQAAAMMQDVNSIYAAGWGETLTGISNDMATVRQNLNGLSQDAATAFTQSAYAVERVAKGQTEISELSKVTRTLMANFNGLGETQALDLITTGFQRGGNYANDLLDTVNEYGVHFAGLGMSAEQMFATLIAGSQQGAWNLDKVGDSVKESFIRMQDLSDTSTGAFKALGLDANKMAANIAAGGDKANQAFQATLLALGNLGSDLDRNTIGVQLFGTQWEDMGDRVVLAMKAGEKGLDGFEGATARAAEALQNNFGFQFEQLKRNFALALAGAGGAAAEAIAPAIAWLNQAFESGRFQPFFDSLATGLDVISKIAGAAMFLAGIILENWPLIAPIVLAIVGALTLYQIALAGAALKTGVLAATELVSAAAKAAFTGATLASVSATAAATAAQWGLNAALLASPITWIILAIVALIALFYLVIAAINKWAGTSLSATGMIVGALAVAGAFIANLFLGLLQIVFGVIEFWYGWFQAIANFLGNVFNDPIGAVIKLFGDLADNVLGVLERIAKAMDTIFGSNMAATVAGWRGGLSNMTVSAMQKYGNGKYEEKVKDLDIDSIVGDLGRFDYGKSWNTGYNWGAGLGADSGGSAANAAAKAAAKEAAAGAGTGVGTGNGKLNNIDKVGEVGKINKSVDISSEDLKTMRELAEMKNIQNFVTLQPSIQFTGANNYNSGYDVDTVIGRIDEYLQTELASNASGVYGAG